MQTKTHTPTDGPWKVTTDRHGRPTMVFSVSRGKGVAKTAWDGYAEENEEIGYTARTEEARSFARWEA